MSLQSAPLAFTASEILAYYSHRVPKLRRATDQTWWAAPCPIHKGEDPNFHVNMETGAWHCHSQCGRGGDLIGLEMELSGAPFLEAKRRVYELVGLPPPPAPKVEPITRKRRPEWMKAVEFYPYQNLDRELKYQTIRYEGMDPDSGEKKKDFSQRQPDRAAGKWIYKEPPDADKILYRWPDWHTSVHVLLVEGERKADDLWKLGLPATSPMGGSSRSWLPQYTAALQGKRVAIFQDNDPANEKTGRRAGAAWALGAAKALHAAGIYVKLLPVVPFEVDNPHGQDSTDWIRIGKATREDIFEFVKSAPVFTPPAEPTEPEPALEPPDPTLETRDAIRAAISQNDLAAIYKLTTTLATWPHSELMALIAQLHQHFGRGFSKRDFQSSIKAVKAEQRAKDAAAKANDGPLPAIVVNNRPVRDVTMDGLKALRALNSPPVLFVRSGEPVYIWRDEKDRPFVATASQDHLRGRLDRSANFVRVTEEGDRHIPVPMEVVKDITSLPSEHLSLPALSAVVEAPTFRPDGTIIDQPGYDDRTGMYYIPSGIDMQPVPDVPTSEDIESSLGWLDEALYDFPFVDAASRANLIGLMLTLVLRPAISSCVPMALIDAPDFGTGKSYLVDLISTIVTGKECPMTVWPPTEEEMRKQIAASLLAGRPIICFDNVTGVVSSASLALALTAHEYETRLLGVTKNVRIPNQSVWIATGNNIRPGGDLPRRCFRIRMDAGTPEPYRNRTFRHYNLLEWALEHRGELIRALLTLGRAWFASGRTSHVAKPLGSFGSWNQIVGSILHHVGIEGLLDNFDDTQAQDEDAMQWESFLLTLAEVYPDGRAFTVVEVIDAIRQGHERLRQALPDYLAEAYTKSPDTTRRKMGNAFARMRERKFGKGGVHLTKMGRSENEKNRVFEWGIKASS